MSTLINNYTNNAYGPNIQHNYEYMEGQLYLEPNILETELYETIRNYENV